MVLLRKRARQRRQREAPRWARVCAWDGHELGAMDHVQVSPHERVCLSHHPQFQAWCRDVSRRSYRVDGVGDEGGEEA